MPKTLRYLIQDVRYSIRSFSKSPGMVAAIVVSIALGIAANTTVFSVVNAVVLGSLPVEAPDRLVALGEGSSLPWPDYLDYRDQVGVFEDVSARFPLVPVSLGGGDPERIWGQAVTANYFDVLGLQPARGRGFVPEESVEAGAKPMIAVINDRLWRRRFGADPSVVGKTAILNNRSYTIVGVMPPGFDGEDRIFVSEFWVPLAVIDTIMPDLAANGDPFDITRRDSSWVSITARMRPGVDRAQAVAAVNLVKDRIDAEFHPDRQGKDPMRLAQAGQMPGVASSYIFGLVASLMIVVGLVLLVACANVANILLARATGRQREIGIRLAMGATRWRMMRQLLTESLMLATGAAMVGVGLTFVATRALSQLRLPLPMPIVFNFSPDARVLLFTVILTIATGVVFGIAPAYRATRTDLVSSIKDGSRSSGGQRRFGLHHVLVSVQIAISMVLLVSAALFLRSLENASTIDIGMNTENILVMGFDPKLHSYTPEQTRTFLRGLRQKVSAQPGVRSVSFTDVMPLGIGNSSSTFRDEASGEDTPRQSADIFNVGSKYFDTLGIPLLRGRDFELADLERDTAIINKKMAEELFGNQNPIGRRVSGNHQSYEIIGVAANAKSRTLGEEQRNCLYQFMERNPESSIVLFGLNILVKTDGNPHLMERTVVQEIHSLDPNLAVFNTKSMDEHLLQALLIPRASAYLFGVFGIIGLTLASVGLYGVMSHSVRMRTKEIGIRRALGARPTQVLRTVLLRGMGLAAIGLVTGLAAAAAIGQLFESYLYGVEAIDRVTFVSVPVLLMLIALVAVLIPARRAARVEPTTALRYE